MLIVNSHDRSRKTRRIKNETEFQMNKCERMMNEEGFVCRDDTMKEHELNLEEKIVFEKFSLYINHNEQVIKTLVTRNNITSLQNTFVPVMMRSTVQKYSSNPIKKLNHHLHQSLFPKTLDIKLPDSAKIVQNHNDPESLTLYK